MAIAISFWFPLRQICLRCCLLIIQTSLMVMRLQFCDCNAIVINDCFAPIYYESCQFNDATHSLMTWTYNIKEQLGEIYFISFCEFIDKVTLFLIVFSISISTISTFPTSEYPLHFRRRVEQLKAYIHYIPRWAYSAAFCCIMQITFCNSHQLSLSQFNDLRGI